MRALFAAITSVALVGTATAQAPAGGYPATAKWARVIKESGAKAE